MGFLSPLTARSRFHFTFVLSMNTDVIALPLPSKVVCRGPRPISGWAAMQSAGLIFPAKASSILDISTTVQVGDTLPEQTAYLPSGDTFTPWGFLGTGILSTMSDFPSLPSMTLTPLIVL